MTRWTYPLAFIAALNAAMLMSEWRQGTRVFFAVLFSLLAIISTLTRRSR